MKAPRKFVITFTGDTVAYITRENVQAGAPRYIDMLLRGDELPDDILRGWGIAVTVEEDCDQGD